MTVNLWFARDGNNEIVSILNSTNQNKYHCPICASKVIPKALESKRITPHFAHMDVSKCNSESMMHWWFKYKFIEKGETFSIKTDKIINFTCKDFKVETTYTLSDGIYRPDLVIETVCGKEVVFEMANTNNKQVKDYIDKWIELDKIIVEIDIKSLACNEKLFNALYYKGKCFNFNKRDDGYYNTIGKLKEDMKVNGKYDIERVKKLDWFWNETIKYKSGTIRIENISISIDALIDSKNKEVINILHNKACNNLLINYIDYVQKRYNSKFNTFIHKLESRYIGLKITLVLNNSMKCFKGDYNGKTILSSTNFSYTDEALLKDIYYIEKQIKQHNIN